MVSIIMPTYNRAHILPRAIESVLNQSYQNFELIIIDDGSSDDTYRVMKSYKDQRIRYIRYTENYGQSHARNVGINMAKGEYIAFLDSDNEWIPSHLEARVNLLCICKNATLIFGRMLKVEDGKEYEKYPENFEIEDV